MERSTSCLQAIKEHQQEMVMVVVVAAAMSLSQQELLPTTSFPGSVVVAHPRVPML